MEHNEKQRNHSEINRQTQTGFTMKVDMNNVQCWISLAPLVQYSIVSWYVESNFLSW